MPTVGSLSSPLAADLRNGHLVKNFPFLDRIPRTQEELRAWLAKANNEFRDILTTWPDFVPFVYDEDADWIVLTAYRYATALLPPDRTHDWLLPETTESHRIFDAHRYVRIYLAACGKPVKSKRKQTTGKKRTSSRTEKPE